MNRHRLFATFAVTATPIVVLALTAATASADTAAQAAVSQNWAGYVAGNTQFSSLSGSWVEPTAKCGSGQTYSAFWVGLGGSGDSGYGDGGYGYGSYPGDGGGYGGYPDGSGQYGYGGDYGYGYGAF